MDKRVKALYYLALVDRWEYIVWDKNAEDYWWDKVYLNVHIDTLHNDAIDYILGDLNETG